jgi:hypothetical protein
VFVGELVGLVFGGNFGVGDEAFVARLVAAAFVSVVIFVVLVVQVVAWVVKRVEVVFAGLFVFGRGLTEVAVFGISDFVVVVVAVVAVV